VTVYPHYIRNRFQWNAMWQDKQPHGYTRPILFLHSVKRVRVCRQTAMTAGKIYHGCFEMLSWPHRISNNIINTYFWLLETCMKCSYFIEENMRPRAQPLAFEVWVYCAPVHKYIVGRQSAFVQVSRQLTLDVLRRLLLLHHSYTMMPMYSSQQRSLSRK